MTKIELLSTLREKLKGYPRDEVDNSIEYYSEMIDDRIEDGMSEAEAVASLGDIDEIVKNIKVNMPLKSVIKNTVHEKREKRGEASVSVFTILMLIIFFPFWFPFITIIFSLMFVLATLLWILDAVLFIAGGASILYFIFSIVAGITSFIMLDPMAGIASLGTGIMAVGGGILLVILGIYFAKGNIKMFLSTLKGIKRTIIGKKKGE